MSECEVTQTVECEIRERILQSDIAILNDRGIGDEVLSLLTAEHAARCETFAKMIEPSKGRAMLLVIAGALLSAVKQIDAATIQEPELVVLR